HITTHTIPARLRGCTSSKTSYFHQTSIDISNSGGGGKIRRQQGLLSKRSTKDTKRQRFTEHEGPAQQWKVDGRGAPRISPRSRGVRSWQLERYRGLRSLSQPAPDRSIRPAVLCAG
ncbi:unnamed protein product, partial [Ectocarpus sp. 12 AP-2014]